MRLAKKANAFSAKGESLRSARRRHKLRIPPPAAKRQAALTPLRLLSPPDPLRWAPAGAPCGKRFDARSAQSVFPTPQRKQTCQRHVCSVGRSGYAARREPCGCSFSSAASGRRNSARLFDTLKSVNLRGLKAPQIFLPLSSSFSREFRSHAPRTFFGKGRHPKFPLRRAARYGKLRKETMGEVIQCPSNGLTS